MGTNLGATRFLRPKKPTPPVTPSYAVYDYEHTNSEGRVFNKLVFINWAPDAAAVKASESESGPQPPTVTLKTQPQSQPQPSQHLRPK